MENLRANKNNIHSKQKRRRKKELKNSILQFLLAVRRLLMLRIKVAQPIKKNNITARFKQHLSRMIKNNQQQRAAKKAVQQEKEHYPECIQGSKILNKNARWRLEGNIDRFGNYQRRFPLRRRSMEKLSLIKFIGLETLKYKRPFFIYS